MKRILLTSDPADGNGTPPKAAQTAANGKSEREIQLERQNAALKLAVKKTAESKRKVEDANSSAVREQQRLAAENVALKELQLKASLPKPESKPVAKAISWGFFNS